MVQYWIVEHNEIGSDNRWLVQAPTEEEALERVRMYLDKHYPDWLAKEKEPEVVYRLELDEFGVCQVY